MSTLSSKIATYTRELDYNFDQSYKLAPVSTGSITSTISYSLTNTAPVHQPSVGPVGGSGSWAFGVNTRFRTTSTVYTGPMLDQDYSVGAWIKIDSVTNTNIATALQTFFGNLGTTTEGFEIRISGGGHGTNPNQFSISSGGTSTFFGPTVQANTWYYIAVIKNSASNNLDVYLNGTYTTTVTNSSSTNPTYFGFGSITTGGSTWNLAHVYVTTSSAIDATAVSEIWTAGSSSGAVDVTITETPATASALQTEPTIAVTVGDHSEVTTSIIVDASMGNATVQVAGFVNVQVTETLTALVEMINNVHVDTGVSQAVSVSEMTATAELIDSFVARSPMTASAESGNHSVYVTPSYYSLIKQSNPLYYFNFDTPTGANYGSMSIASYTKGSTMSTNQTSGGDMGLIGSGLSWAGTGNYNNAPNTFKIYPTAPSDISNLVSSRNFTIEVWSKGEGNQIAGFGNVALYNGGVILSRLVSQLNPSYEPGNGQQEYITEKVIFINTSSLYKTNDWNHYVVKVVPGSGTNELVASIYLNGSFAGSATNTLDPTLFTSTTWDYFGVGTSEDNLSTPDYVDEFAVYGSGLSNSTIIDHYSFINNLSPDRIIFPLPITAFAESGSHNFVVNSNAIQEVTVATASANIVNPTIIVGVSKDIAADVLIASAAIVQSSAQYGNTAIATALIAYAESANAFALSDMYYNYVIANVAPYRYVTFDGANTLLDYGSDNDYAVAPVTVGGTVVNPDFGINGKSAKTAGTSYVTDGVILKESEWNDNWGTGLNNYHSSFWFRKADEDTSTGLRVLWNLNGYYDNQHVILYQYQNKLHLQFNNGSGTYIDQATISNYNLFDGLRHFIVVAFDHTGSNNRVNLFVDGVDIMNVALGSYNGTTVNGITSVPANDEANNHPRLSVGCLITPFGSTALPVVPTNTIIYVDEVIWAKTSASQTLVSNLYGMMPGQTNEVIAATALTASALATTATISASVDYAADWALAEADPIDATVSVIRNIIATSAPMLATAEAKPAGISWPASINADIMVATAIFNSAGVKITIPGGPMLATIEVINNYFDGIVVTTNTFSAPVSMYNLASPWAAWLRATDVEGIYPTREVI